MTIIQKNDNHPSYLAAIELGSHLTHPKYRADIDGLRAIAVLSVVGFHAYPSWVKGGFVGVDIFFVISGFLISKIIFGSLERDAFSFTEFYGRRIRRIFPGLLLVLLVTYLIGWYILLADDYMQLGSHVAAGAGFVSNFALWSENGYFDNVADTKPLLHLWSLGIEEQFYIVWPLLLWTAWKKRFNLLAIILFVAFVSFVLNIKGVSRDAVAAFYSPQTRFWELLAGSLLAWVSLYKKSTFSKLRQKIDRWFGIAFGARAPEKYGKPLRNVQSVVGLILIIIAVLTITKENSFPGWWALLPTLGAVLVISAGAHAWVNHLVLSNRLLVWFGLISFPLYLWHWPLLTFARIMEGEVPSWEIRTAVVAISVVLAWLTYRLIEKQMRYGRHGKSKLFILIALMCVVGSVGYYTYLREGIPSRAYPRSAEGYLKTIAKANGREAECFEIPYAYKISSNWYCTIGSPSHLPEIFVFGDSHALSLLPTIERYANMHKVSVLFTGASGCPPLLGIQSVRGKAEIEKNNCQELNNRIFEHVKDSNIKTVLLVARWTYYTGGKTRPAELNLLARVKQEDATIKNSIAAFDYGLRNTVEKYNSIGVHVVFVEDNPQQIFDPKDALKKSRTFSDDVINRYSVSRSEHELNQAYVAHEMRKLKGQMVTLVNFDDLLCDKISCQLVKNNQFMYFDDDHLSNVGANIVYPAVAKALEVSRLNQ